MEDSNKFVRLFHHFYIGVLVPFSTFIHACIEKVGHDCKLVDIYSLYVITQEVFLSTRHVCRIFYAVDVEYEYSLAYPSFSCVLIDGIRIRQSWRINNGRIRT